MKLRFKTDRSVTKKGFKVRLTAACGGFLTGTRGVIKTPGYPNDYSPNLDCVWRVQVTPGRKIRVNFNSIDLSTSDSQCPTDFITLRNGLSELSPLMLINSNQAGGQNGRICQPITPSSANTSSNSLLLRFTSDGEGSGSGFLMEWKETLPDHGCGGHIHIDSDTSGIFNYHRTNLGVCKEEKRAPISQCHLHISTNLSKHLFPAFSQK